MNAMRMIMGSVQSVSSVARKFLRLNFTGLGDEEIEDRIHIQQYGFQSRPRKGSRLIAFQQGDQIIVIGSDDHEYRMALEEGDVVLYSDSETFVKLGGSGGVEVKTKNASIVIDQSGTVDINNGALEVLA